MNNASSIHAGMKSCPCGPTGPSYAADGSPARESPTSGVQTAKFVSLSAALLPWTSIDGVIDDDAKNACMTTKQTILRVPGSRNAPTFQGKRRIVAYSTPAQPSDDFRAEQLLNAQPQSHQPPNGPKMRRTAPPPGLPRRPPNSCSFRNHTFRNHSLRTNSNVQSTRHAPKDVVQAEISAAGRQTATAQQTSLPANQPISLPIPQRTAANYRAPMHQPLGFGFMGAGVGKRDERIHNRDWGCGSGVAALGTTACCQ